ncbi:MAG: Rpn family recombination-promoting nuclease/putative transposase [Okeania sp. SIO3I5]|uniref:Rpn family recombination-promoting nuclease/putative transposase n=1 Tax=Okeania sp. SIO3I5 TaxID=2607805 RepID=UPI0013BA2A67|nr:Rpn family recombination-promoting nuclease/putative transposase [Okeania sp. SIO3I5]NEQ38524.1 Rpn family recombination-promoting nuclease/putative transposase [Okeania sp. SIO3I5]
MKTDSIFYQIFLNFPTIFFELINQPNTNTQTYEFTSREVKQLSFRLDALFLPTDNNPNKPFYLVEVQFKPDDNLYYRLFAELFLFLRQYQPPYPWQVVVIYPSRNIEREQNQHFGNILASNQVQRIYLNELEETVSGSLGVGVVKLVIEPETQAINLAKSLISQTKEEIIEPKIQQDLIDLIETIIVYKLPQKTRKEIEAMLGLSELKKTKVYQEAFAEGEDEGKEKAHLKSLSNMIRLGLTLETIAEYLDLPLQEVQRLAKLTENRD